jgi:hypothetical protein
MPAWWTPWSHLSRWGQVKRVLAIAFATYHLAAVGVMGAAPKVRQLLGGPFTFYGDKLKLTNTWGMFSKRPSSTHVRVEAVDEDGKVWTLSTTEAQGKDLHDRFRDARLRKIQSKLGNKKDRQRFGAELLDGWCRYKGHRVEGVREVRAVEMVHELRDERGKVVRTAHEEVVMRRTCGRLRPHTLPVREVDRDGEAEDT